VQDTSFFSRPDRFPARHLPPLTLGSTKPTSPYRWPQADSSEQRTELGCVIQAPSPAALTLRSFADNEQSDVAGVGEGSEPLAGEVKWSRVRPSS
jgi:hypothetical protein